MFGPFAFGVRTVSGAAPVPAFHAPRAGQQQQTDDVGAALVLMLLQGCRQVGRSLSLRFPRSLLRPMRFGLKRSGSSSSTLLHKTH